MFILSKSLCLLFNLKVLKYNTNFPSQVSGGGKL